MIAMCNSSSVRRAWSTRLRKRGRRPTARSAPTFRFPLLIRPLCQSSVILDPQHLQSIMPLPSLSSFTRSELAKRPASAAVATSFHRSQADFVEGDTISIDLEQTWNQFIAAERSASLHIGQYLRFKGTEGGRHLVRGLGSNDSAGKNLHLSQVALTDANQS